MGETVAVKVFLHSGQGRGRRREEEGLKENVRRFLLDKDSADLSKFQQKICQIYPDISENGYSLSWLDEEDDNVTVSNEEDLAIALMEMPGPIYTFCINRQEEVESNLKVKEKNLKQRRNKSKTVKTLQTAKRQGQNRKMNKEKEKSGYKKG